MRKSVLLAMAGFILITESAWAQKASGSRRPTPMMRSQPVEKSPEIKTVGAPISVTPASMTFTSSTPDTTQVNAATAVSFRTTANPASFHVYAKAGAANFTGCNTPPASSITATCGTAVGVTCAAAAVLSNTGNGTTVATGKGNHNPGSFKVTYTFQDSWTYSVGSTCQLSVSYIYTEP